MRNTNYNIPVYLNATRFLVTKSLLFLNFKLSTIIPCYYNTQKNSYASTKKKNFHLQNTISRLM